MLTSTQQALPLGLTSVTVGTGTTTSSIITLSLPYTVNLNPGGTLSGAGYLVLSKPITSARLSSSDVSQSSSGAFSDATCDFYIGSSTADGLLACTGDILGHGKTNGEVTLGGAAGCVACTYTTGGGGDVE